MDTFFVGSAEPAVWVQMRLWAGRVWLREGCGTSSLIGGLNEAAHGVG